MITNHVYLRFSNSPMLFLVLVCPVTTPAQTCGGRVAGPVVGEPGLWHARCARRAWGWEACFLASPLLKVPACMQPRERKETLVTRVATSFVLGLHEHSLYKYPPVQTSCVTQPPQWISALPLGRHCMKVCACVSVLVGM